MFSDPNDVLDALPVPPKLGAGQQATRIAPARGLGLELIGQGVELAPGPAREAAVTQFLKSEGEPVLQVAPAENRCLACRTALATSRAARGSTCLSGPRSVTGPCRSSPDSPLPCGRMTASAGRQVQSLLLQKAQASQPCSQKVSDFGQALLGSHQVGRQGVGAGKAAIEIVGAGTGVCAHLPPALR